MCTVCGKARQDGHDWSSDCGRCVRCGEIRVSAHNWTADCEKCGLCGKRRMFAHDWSNDCNKCGVCGFIPSDKLRIKKALTIEGDYLEIYLPRVEITGETGAHLAPCRNAARAILPRLRSFEGAALKVVVPYTHTSVPETYFRDNPGDDTHGWHTTKGGSKTSAEVKLYPLHEAVSGHLKELTTWLLANQPNVDRISGRTPLHLAASEGHKDVVRFLLDNDANVNARDNKGRTPLHDAASGGFLHVVELLLANNADINARTELNIVDKWLGSTDGKTPLGMAEYKWKTNRLFPAKGVAEFLRQHGGHE